MKRKWKKLIVSLMSGIMIATTAATTAAATTTIVGATTVNEMTVSDNVLQDINQDSEKNNIDPENEDVKLTYDQYDMLTDEEVQRELSATATESQDIMKTESGACKYLFLGDSVMCGGYTDQSGNAVTSFVTYLDRMRPSFIINKAVGGATYTTVHEPNVMTELNGINIADFDAVFLYFGVNDYCISATIGNAGSTGTATTCGALNAIINKVNNAGAKCYVILPFPCKQQFGNETNMNGYTYLAYVSGIRKVCEKKDVTIIDFNKELNVNKDNFVNYYVDAIHPNNQLQQLAANYLNTFLGEDTGAQDSMTGFVERLYKNCLGRTSDQEGLRHWTELLKNKDITGAATAQGFFFSKEFINKNVDNGEYVELLYQTLMDRHSDPAGYANWVNLLENGVSREKVFSGFCASKEFGQICKDYGIERGEINLTAPRDQNEGLTQFVARLYTKALGRTYDLDGLNFWCNEILTGKQSITQVSTEGFFHSREFYNKNLSDGEYVKVLYRTFLDREYDQDGYEFWKKELANGKSRDEVLLGFANSKEFSEIKQKYGLQ